MEHGFHQVVFRMSRIDHIGIATNDISKASEFWLMIGLQQGEDHVNLEQDVKIRMFHGNGENGSKTHSKVELIEALSEKSTIARFIEKRGEGIHHIAFAVEDIKSEMKRLAGEGFQLLSEEPKPGADNKLVAFLHPKTTNGVLIELCQDRK